MSIATEPKLLEFHNWIFRWQPAQAKPDRLLVLLHGWTGDENSMWTLTRHLAPIFSILAPRAPYSTQEGGYSWREIKPGTWGMSTLYELRPVIDALLSFVDLWSASVKISAPQFDVMGFSQGAATAYSVALLYPSRVHSLAALSGFLPEGAEKIALGNLLSEKPVFISHGRQDDMVPVEHARRSAAWLKESGASVSYCESDGGHKVSKECLQAMEAFFGGN